MRKKADGHLFENEFENSLGSKFYVRRLPTLNTGFSGLSQPADFIVIGDKFNYVEVKETAGDSFSITSMQQYQEMLDFLEDKVKLSSAGRAVREMNYWLIVHYVKRGVIKAIAGEYAVKLSKLRRTLKYNGGEGFTFLTLSEVKEGLDL